MNEPFRKRHFWLNALIYVAATLQANFTADLFLSTSLVRPSSGAPALPLGPLLSVGTLFFAVTFTQRDRMHAYGGRRAVYGMIALAAAANTLASAYLHVPWRIVLASFAAIVLAEAADTEVYERYIRRPWLERVARSNSVSIPVDTILFTLIAFAGEQGFPPLVLFNIILGDVVLKMVIGLLVALRRPAEDVRPAAEVPPATVPAALSS